MAESQCKIAQLKNTQELVESGVDIVQTVESHFHNFTLMVILNAFRVLLNVFGDS